MPSPRDRADGSDEPGQGDGFGDGDEGRAAARRRGVHEPLPAASSHDAQNAELDECLEGAVGMARGPAQI
eukprot:11197546-Lingulodinium_polyedra.AAC.1